jgi:hypothetical protein
MKELSEFAFPTLVETADIGGTSSSSGYVSMANYDRAQAYFELGTWDSGDDLDECRLEQAKTSGGGDVKELTTDASGGNYDTDNPIDADGDFVIIEVRAENLDVDGGFSFIRTLAGEGGNTGVDNVTTILQRYDYAYPQAQLPAAAVTGSKVYVHAS